MKQDHIQPNFQQVPLQQVTIEAEVIRGKSEEEETKVTFLDLFFFLQNLNSKCVNEKP